MAGIPATAPPAANSSGRVTVAWHDFRQNNCDIYLRQRSPHGGWDGERRLTRAESIDRHAVLVPHKDDLWLVYENASTEAYSTGRTNERRVMLARIMPRGLESPKNYRAASPLYGRCEAPAAAFDSMGRIWIAYLQPRLPRGGWDLYFTGFNGQAWQPAKAVSTFKGMDRRPSIVVEGSWAIVAFQVDDLPETWASAKPELTDNARSRIFLASIDLAGTLPPRPMSVGHGLERHRVVGRPAGWKATVAQDPATAVDGEPALPMKPGLGFTGCQPGP